MLSVFSDQQSRSWLLRGMWCTRAKVATLPFGRGNSRFSEKKSLIKTKPGTIKPTRWCERKHINMNAIGRIHLFNFISKIKSFRWIKILHKKKEEEYTERTYLLENSSSPATPILCIVYMWVCWYRLHSLMQN